MKRELSRRRAVGAALGAALALSCCAPDRLCAQALRGGARRGALDATHEGLSPGAPDDQSAALRPRSGEGRSGGPAALPAARPLRGRRRRRCRATRTSDRRARAVARSPSAAAHACFAARARRAAAARRARRSTARALPLDGPVPACSTPKTSPTSSSTIARSSEAARAGAKLRACAGRVENCRVASDRHGRPLTSTSRAAWRSAATSSPIAATPAFSSAATRRARTARSSRGNRVSRIRADSGGTGQNGNGINLDKANGVIVADNRVDDCAFSAIRCFSSDAISGHRQHRARAPARWRSTSSSPSRARSSRTT